MHGGVMKQRKLKTQKHSEDKINKNTRNIFRIKKENEAIKDRIIRDTRVGKLWNNNSIEYKSNYDGNKTLPLKDTINNLQRSDISKVQLTIVIDFIYSNDNDEEHVVLCMQRLVT